MKTLKIFKRQTLLVLKSKLNTNPCWNDNNISIRETIRDDIRNCDDRPRERPKKSRSRNRDSDILKDKEEPKR